MRSVLVDMCLEPAQAEQDDSDGSESDGHGETRLETIWRYQQSSMDEVSDVDLWMTVLRGERDENMGVD